MREFHLTWPAEGTKAGAGGEGGNHAEKRSVRGVADHRPNHL